MIPVIRQFYILPLFVCLLGAWLTMATMASCASTGDRSRDEARRNLLVAACKAQCSVALNLLVDACDGKLDGVSTPDPEKPLQAVCIQEAQFAQLGCPLACDAIPLPKDTPPAEPDEPGPNVSPAE